MSAQRAPCAMNDSPVVILSRFSLPAPRSSTWMNRKKKSFFSWQVKITIRSSLPSKCIQRKSHGFCHEKGQHNWQKHVRFYVETVDQFRSRYGGKQSAAVLNSRGVFKQAMSTCSHTPPNPRGGGGGKKFCWPPFPKHNG